MILCDVNVLIYAHREECDRHDEYKAWLEGIMRSGSAYGVSDLVLSGCLRILTHVRIFDPPSPARMAMAFVSQIREDRHAVVISQGPRQWSSSGSFVILAARGATLSRMRISPRSPLSQEVNGSVRTGTTRDSPAFVGATPWKNEKNARIARGGQDCRPPPPPPPGGVRSSPKYFSLRYRNHTRRTWGIFSFSSFVRVS